MYCRLTLSRAGRMASSVSLKVCKQLHVHVLLSPETSQSLGLDLTSNGHVVCLFVQNGTHLTYSWIGHRLQTGLTLAFLLWLSDFKTKTSFGFPSANYTGHVFWFFFKKTQNELVWPFLMFLAILAKNLMILRYWRHVSEFTYIASVELVCAYEIKKYFVHTM